VSDSAPRGTVFISFASEDLEVADRFLASLEHAGVKCWIAHRDIAPGKSYPVEITGAIKSAGALLVLVTAAANDSPHVLREVELAFGSGKPILPVTLSTVALSPSLNYFLSTKQWLDAGPSFDAGDIERVRVALERLLLEGPVPVDGRTGRADHVPWWRQRATMIAGLAAVLLLAATSLMLNPWNDPPRGPDAKSPVGGSPAPTATAPTSSRPPEKTEVPATVGVTPPASAVPPPANAVPPAAAGSPRARTRVNKADGQTYAWIPPGEFVMGCSPGDPACDPDEQPAHPVTVRGFWLAQTELTGAHYRNVRPKGSGSAITPDSPITGLTWAEAKAYCAAAGGRLPTEAEWEYAARAGSTARAYGRPGDIGWHMNNSGEGAHPVAKLKPNAFGLYDMLGNVHEWVLDRYFNSYGDGDDEDKIIEPTAPNASATVRGGAWTTEPGEMRVSMRLAREPHTADPNIGVRCAQD
jgi:formylglycine-generating enzyme required for sulfatase activity